MKRRTKSIVLYSFIARFIGLAGRTQQFTYNIT